MRILIADDNHFYRCALKATLSEWGYDVLAVADGAAAWAVPPATSSPVRSVASVARTARPTAPPTCTLVLTRPEASPASCGETPIIAVAPAVTAAIHHAAGVRLNEIPATPERVWAALEALPPAGSTASRP